MRAMRTSFFGYEKSKSALPACASLLEGGGAAEATRIRAAVPAGGNGGGAAACDSGRPLTLHARRCADARDVGVSGGLLRLPCGYARRRCTTPESRAGGSRSVVRAGKTRRNEEA